MKKLAVSLVIAIAAATGLVGASAASALPHTISSPCCKQVV